MLASKEGVLLTGLLDSLNPDTLSVEDPEEE
jgi:hypothetical protein